MSLAERINLDMKNAMKSGDKEKAGTLKMVKSDLTYEKARTGEELTEEQVLEVVAKAAKRRKESIREYDKGGRSDLSEVEARELAIIEVYLPEQMSEEEVGAEIEKILAGLGNPGPGDFGKVMGSVMKELKGKAEGNLVKEILKKKLES